MSEMIVPDSDGQHRDQIVAKFIDIAQTLHSRLDNPYDQRLLVAIVESFRDRDQLQKGQVEAISNLLMEAMRQRDLAFEERDDLLRLLHDIEDEVG